MRKQLVILVADKNAHFTFAGLLTRHHALSIAPINEGDFDIFVHPHHDPGVYNQAAEFLRPYQNQYRYALVCLDREGSGQENKTATDLAREIKEKLERNGWRNRSEVIVFDPELEIWAWTNSPHLAAHTGWPDFTSLKEFLMNHGIWRENSPKPERPKEAFEALLKEKRIQRSSSIYKNIAITINFTACTDAMFIKFRTVLNEWFGI